MSWDHELLLPDVFRADEEKREQESTQKLKELEAKVKELEAQKTQIHGLGGVNIFGVELNTSVLLLMALVGLTVYICTKEDRQPQRKGFFGY